MTFSEIWKVLSEGIVRFATKLERPGCYLNKKVE
jgi:hypothetical protein